MEIKEVVVAFGLVFMIGSVIYLLWTLRSSIEKERKRIAKG